MNERPATLVARKAICYYPSVKSGSWVACSRIRLTLEKLNRARRLATPGVQYVLNFGLREQSHFKPIAASYTFIVFAIGGAG